MESVKDKIEDIYDGMKERLKSPFILTFVTVWVVRHWELVYLVFNFGADYTAIQKLKMVIIALKGETYRELFWIPLFISLGSFAGYLIVSLLYELIHSLYSKWGRTFIYYISDRNKLVKREDYDQLQKELDDLDSMYETLEEDYENLKEDNLDKFNKLNSIEAKIEEKERANSELSSQIDLFNFEIKRLTKIEDEHKKLISNEQEFLTMRAKNLIYYLFKYFFIEKVFSGSYIQLTELFFGKWVKKIIKKDDISSQLSGYELVFEGRNAVGTDGKFRFEVLDILKLNNDNFYVVETRDNTNQKKSEIIFVLTNELYYGLIGTFKNEGIEPNLTDIKNNFSVDYIVQYEKIKS